MLKNLIRIAIRNFKKDWNYSLLNVLGLTIGITFSLFLAFYIMDELSYDRYHEKAERIYRVNSYINEPENSMKWAITPFPMSLALKKDYPEVEEATRIFANAAIFGNERVMYKNGDLHLYQDKNFFSDSNIFKIFTFNFIEGSPGKALTAPNSMVLTQTVAEKFFGKNNKVLGKSLQNSQGSVYKITAVIEDVPKHSHIIFNTLISISTLPKDFSNNWGNFGYYTYVLLRPNTSSPLLEKKMASMYGKYLAPIFAQYKIKIHFGLQPISDIHLYSDMANEPEELGSVSYIYIFSAVALFMLIIACINYMNLTTARSARRAKEIGIRKVTGSSKGQLVAQFLTESTLTALVSLLVSLLLTALLLPIFNTLSGKFLSLQTFLQPQTLILILIIVLFVGLLGGSYPAFYLSKFKPVDILKGSLSKSSSNVTLRRTLVVIQFSISMIMLICTWVVYGQLKYLKNKDLGFNKEQVVSLTVDGNNIESKVLTLKNQLRKNTSIISVSSSQNIPGRGTSFNLYSVETKNGYTDKGVDNYAVDESYLPTLGIALIKGRNFSGPADTLRSIMVNESMVKYFGWDNPLSKKIKFPGDTTGNYVEVVGVFKDFNQKSLYNPITPLILFYRPNSNILQVKIQAGNIPSTVSGIEKSWAALFPELPFQYTFLDQDFDSQYAADQKRGKIFTSFSLLTILITCLGLLGLIAFITEQRQKEISIRKIMGAGLQQIIPLITLNFVALVGLSCLIAFPVAYYFMDKWLKIFPYNTGLKPSTFLLSALVVLFITLFTVIFHTIKAGLANPVKSLRSE